MNVQINETMQSTSGKYVRATCGKTSALVSVYSHGVQVCCQNSAHKVWRGAGRFFPTVTDALAAYRSGEMKAIIEAATVA